MNDHKSRWLVGANIFKSGIVDLWFNAIIYCSVAAAFAIIADSAYPLAWILAVVSYYLTGVYIVFKSRQVYENLSEIYVYSQTKFFSHGRRLPYYSHSEFFFY